MKMLIAFALFLTCMVQTMALRGQPHQSATPVLGSIPASIPLQEKIYMHSDREFYLAGETIWFRIYCVDHAFKPSLTSSIAYAELLDASHFPIVQAKISLEKNKSHGSFRIPLNITSGIFILRGYTSLMRIAGPETFFEKKIIIINTLKKFEPSKSSPPDIHFNFFPEGGNLVAALDNRIAFKLTNAEGKGLDCRGVVFSGTDTVARFSSVKYGMGSFHLTPKAGVSYSALIVIPDGRALMYSFPPIEEHGYVMQVSDMDRSHFRAVIKSTEKGFSKLNLEITNRHSEVMTREVVMSDGTGDVVLDLSGFEDGMMQLTLYDASGRPLSERLKFIRPSVPPQISISTSGEWYDSRKQVHATVQASETNPFSSTTDMSVSVYLIDSLEPGDASTIRASLWFDGYLKGKIESASYYFDSLQADAGEALDNLLMTQGWRKIRQLNAGQNKMVFVPEMNGHFVTAIITNERTGLPEKNKQVFLSVPSRHFGFYTAESDADGMVRFEVRNVEGPSEMIVQTQLMDSMFRVRLLNPYSDQYQQHDLMPFQLKWGPDGLRKRSVALQAQLIFSGSRENVVHSINHDTLPFFGKADATYLLDDYKRFTTMEEVLREYVREVNVSVQDGTLALKMYNKKLMNSFSDGILVMIDGVALADPNKIFMVDPLTIKKLDIISRSYILGPAVFSGILSFTTEAGNAPGLKDLYPSLVRMDYEGIQLEREFYAPVYETREGVTNRIPDLRSTLYWNPHLKIMNSGSTSFNFYTSDMKGRFLVKAEGIDGNGYPFTASTVITVK